MNPIFTCEYFYPVILFSIIVASQFNKEARTTHKRMSLDITYFDALLALFVVFIGIDMYLTSPVPLRVQDYYPLLTCIMLYLAARFFLPPSIEGAARTVFWIIVLTGLSEALIGVLQALHLIRNSDPLFTVGGSFGNAAAYSNFLVSVLPFSIFLLFSENDRPGKKALTWLLAGTSVLIVFVLFFLTTSRLAWGASTGIIASAWWIKKGHRPRLEWRSSRTRILILSSIIFAGVCMYLLFFYKSDSTAGRWFVLTNSMHLFQEHYVRGIGFGNFARYYNDFQQLYFRTHTDPRHEYLASYVLVGYNEYLQITLEGGIPGLLFMAALLWRAIVIVKRRRISGSDLLAGAGLLCCAAVLALGLLSFPFRCLPVLSNFIPGLAILGSLDDKKIAGIKGGRRYFFPVIAAGSLLLTSGILLQFNSYVKWWAVSRYFAKAEATASREKIGKIYENLLPRLYNDETFMEDYADKLYLQKDYLNSARILTLAARSSSNYAIWLDLARSYEKQGHTSLAEETYLRCCYLVPNKFYPRYRLMMLYFSGNKLQEAVKWAKIIGNMPVKVSSDEVRNIKFNAMRITQIDSTSRWARSASSLR